MWIDVLLIAVGTTLHLQMAVRALDCRIVVAVVLGGDIAVHFRITVALETGHATRVEVDIGGDHSTLGCFVLPLVLVVDPTPVTTRTGQVHGRRVLERVAVQQSTPCTGWSTHVALTTRCVASGAVVLERELQLG